MFGGKRTAPAPLNEETLDTRAYMYVVHVLIPDKFEVVVATLS